jgi:hypothetical protein
VCVPTLATVRAIRVAALVMILVVGCSSGGGARASKPGPTPGTRVQRFVVTRDAASAPERCTPAAIGDLVVRFFRAVNSGHLPSVDQYFAPSGVFQWYSEGASSTPRIGQGARDILAAYFTKRHRHHEKLRLVELDLEITHRDTRDTADFGYTLVRTADDLPARDKYTPGKGVVDCATGKIMVWSLGHPRAARTSRPCPQPISRASEGTAIICARS